MSLGRARFFERAIERVSSPCAEASRRAMDDARLEQPRTTSAPAPHVVARAEAGRSAGLTRGVFQRQPPCRAFGPATFADGLCPYPLGGGGAVRRHARVTALRLDRRSARGTSLASSPSIMPGDGGRPALLIGAFLLLGYVAHVVGRRAHVPRVTLLLLVGLLLGPSAMAVVPEDVAAWFPTVAQMALSMVGFMLGEQLTLRRLRAHGRLVLVTALFECVIAAAAVTATTAALGASLPLALLLGGIASASAPAATLDVVREAKAHGPVTDTVLGVVAVDDAYCVLVFTLAVMLAQALSGGSAPVDAALHGLWEVFGAVGIGLLVGAPMAALTGRVRPGELTLIEAMGFVLVCGGLAKLLETSYLLACMTCGAVVANGARHHVRPFHAIEGVSQPFLIVFFVLAGFEFQPEALGSIGAIGAGYLASRAVGKLVGGAAGSALGGAPPIVRRYLGFCLLPQAGVTLGLALLAADRFPKHAPILMSLVVGTTFAFELVGPVATRVALGRAGETESARAKRPS